MDVKEVRERRIILAQHIAELIRVFESESEVQVKDISIQRAHYVTGKSELASVDVRIEIDG